MLPHLLLLYSTASQVRIVDRMVNQNTFADVAMDFKYWDDTSDALRCGLVWGQVGACVGVWGDRYIGSTVSRQLGSCVALIADG
jgi:hypothetical protein